MVIEIIILYYGMLFLFCEIKHQLIWHTNVIEMNSLTALPEIIQLSNHQLAFQ